jgi:hypothetical protein
MDPNMRKQEEEDGKGGKSEAGRMVELFQNLIH